MMPMLNQPVRESTFVTAAELSQFPVLPCPGDIQGSGLSIILANTRTGFITIQGSGIDIDNQGLIDVTDLDLTGGSFSR